MEFTRLVNSFKNIYEDYKKTRSFEELRRRMLEAEKVMGRLYMDDRGKDKFSGNYNKWDGTMRLDEDERRYKKWLHKGAVNTAVKNDRITINARDSRKLSNLNSRKVSKLNLSAIE